MNNPVGADKFELSLHGCVFVCRRARQLRAREWNVFNVPSTDASLTIAQPLFSVSSCNVIVEMHLAQVQAIAYCHGMLCARLMRACSPRLLGSPHPARPRMPNHGVQITFNSTLIHLSPISYVYV